QETVCCVPQAAGKGPLQLAGRRRLTPRASLADAMHASSTRMFAIDSLPGSISSHSPRSVWPILSTTQRNGSMIGVFMNSSSSIRTAPEASILSFEHSHITRYTRVERSSQEDLPLAPEDPCCLPARSLEARGKCCGAALPEIENPIKRNIDFVLRVDGLV